MEKENGFSVLSSGSWTPQVAHSRQPLALVLSDRVRTLRELTSQRSKAALPFAGKYRLIDFALSSCVNSGIERVGVITQYQPRTLHMHLAYGRPWDLDRSEAGLTVLHPYQARAGMDWYAGTADAVYQNLDFVFRGRPDEVLILPGDQVYSIDLGLLAERHHKAKADLTVVVAAVEGEIARRHHTVIVDDEGWLQALVPPEVDPPGPLAVVGILLFSTDVLSWRLSEDAQQPGSTHDLIRDLLPRMIGAGDRVMAFRYSGYWNALRAVHDYWRAHMHLVTGDPKLNLQDTAWPIRTQAQIRPPTRISARARVSHSLLSEGCVIEGTVEYSVLSPGVCVAPGAVVRNAVVMHDTTIEECAVVENAILDMDVIVGSHARVGPLDRRAPTLSVTMPEPLTVVTRGVHMPAYEVVRTYGLTNDRLAHRQGVPNAQLETAQ